MSGQTAHGDAASGDGAPASCAAGSPASGVVRKEDADPEPGGAPPWAMLSAYLTRGEHGDRVEAHAARSRAFAEVLAALRHDQEERAAARGQVLPFRR